MSEVFKKFENKELSPAERLVEEYLCFFKPLDHTRRFGNKSGTWEESQDLNQSITEHLGGMQYLTEMVLERDLVIPTEFDRNRIRKMILVHDLHEGHIDDVVYKTEARRAEEAEWDSVISNAYSQGGDLTTGALIREYNEKISPEAKFVKALDHLEALLTLLYADRIDKVSNREAYNDKIIAGVEEISPLLAQTIKLVNGRLLQRREEIGQQELDL